jgi:hypothetical protein
MAISTLSLTYFLRGKIGHKGRIERKEPYKDSL